MGLHARVSSSLMGVVSRSMNRRGTSASITTRPLLVTWLITRATRKGPMPAPRWRPVTVKGKPLSLTVIDDREDGA